MDLERLCAASGDGVTLLARGSSGTWTARRVLDVADVRCLAADPVVRHVVYAGSTTSGVYRSLDAGESWQRIAGEGPQAVFSLAVSPSWRGKSDGVVLAGTEPSALYVSENGGESWTELASLRDIPSAPTWSFPPRPWTSRVRWIAPSPSEPGLILVGIELGGIMRTTDFGRAWEDHRPGAYRDSHQLAFHPNARGRAYEAAGDGGGAISVDGGDTWTKVTEGLARRYGWALAADAVDPNCWYLSASPGPFQAHHEQGRADSVIYRTRDNISWEALRGGLPFPSRYLFSALYADPGRAGHLYAGLRSGEVYFTSDHGDTWEQLPVGAPRVEALCACG